jgi:hypothetical protein
MVIRAKFENLGEQREFFVNVKSSLGVGARRLSRLLGMPSRGPLENYTLCYTAPPVDLVKRLEDMSGIRAPRFECVKGCVKRKKRRLMPMNLDEANILLKNKFGNHYPEILKLAKDGTKINIILSYLRKNGFRFDSVGVAGALGTLKKSFLFRVVDDIETRESIIVKGYVQDSKGSSEITFHLLPLAKKASSGKMRIGFDIMKDLKYVKIYPLQNGRKLRLIGSRTIRFLLPQTLGMKHHSAIYIVLSPTDFGFKKHDLIQDDDAKLLAQAAEHVGIELHPMRATNSNSLGDVVFSVRGKLFAIEITRALASHMSKFKLGQCLVQKLASPDSRRIIVCKKELFSEEELRALNFIDVTPIYTAFGKGWEEEVINKINNLIQCNDASPNRS